MTDLPEPISRRDRQRQTREAIIFAARAVFAEEGYHGARLDRIAQAAGFSKGAVYSNFSGKADLFLAVMDKNIEESVAQGGWDVFKPDHTDSMNLSGNSQVAEVIKGFALATLEFVAMAARDESLNEQVAQRINQLVVLYTGVVEISWRSLAGRTEAGGEAGQTEADGGAGRTEAGGETGQTEADGGASRTEKDGGNHPEPGKTEDPLTSEQLGALLAALDQGAAVLSLAGSSVIDQSLLRTGILRLLEPGQTAEPEPGSHDEEGETALHHRIIRERIAQALAMRGVSGS